MKELILFILTFLFTFIVYYLLIKEKKFKRKKKKDKKPMEVKYLMERYNLDMTKIKYNRLILLISAVNAFDIALLVTMIGVIKSTILQIIFVIVFIIPMVMISYSLIGRHYKKKGMTKDES